MIKKEEIIELLKKANISDEIRNYWIHEIPSLSSDELEKLYRSLSVKSIEELDKIESEEIEYQKLLKKKLEDIPNIIKKLFKDFEAKIIKEENPDNLLVGIDAN